MKSDYTIIRCFTTDKFKVMDLLCDANEYKLIRNYVDVVYYNGDTLSEKKETRKLIKNNIKNLIAHCIWAESTPEFVDDWFLLKR